MKKKAKAKKKAKQKKTAKPQTGLVIPLDAQEAAVVVKGLVNLPLAMNNPLYSAAQRVIQRVQVGAQQLAEKQQKKKPKDAARG